MLKIKRTTYPTDRPTNWEKAPIADTVTRSINLEKINKRISPSWDLNSYTQKDNLAIDLFNKLKANR